MFSVEKASFNFKEKTISVSSSKEQNHKQFRPKNSLMNEIAVILNLSLLSAKTVERNFCMNTLLAGSIKFSAEFVSEFSNK